MTWRGTADERSNLQMDKFDGVPVSYKLQRCAMFVSIIVVGVPLQSPTQISSPSSNTVFVRALARHRLSSLRPLSHYEAGPPEGAHLPAAAAVDAREWTRVRAR